jgi:hypothetical protein
MKKLWMTLTISTLVSMLACQGNQGGIANSRLISNSLDSMYISSYPSNNNNLRISLTDAPSKDLKSVFVNVDHAELFVKKGSSEGRLIVAQDLGLIDLMSLKNGVLLPVQDLSLPVGLEITAIRLVLKGDNNYSIKSDDSRCDMQTPSGQQSGIKIHLSQPFLLEQDQVYSMVMDFDAEKSVVIKGNGGCLLKPVLKLLSVTRSSNNSGDDPITDGTDSNTSTDPAAGGNSSGFEVAPLPVDKNAPPVYTIEETFNLA